MIRIFIYLDLDLDIFDAVSYFDDFLWLIYPPKCFYFVEVGGLACLADPRGYASWSV